MFNDEQLKAFHAFEDCGSIRELRRQLDDGLISNLEFTREVRKVWGYFRTMPQYSHLNLPVEG